jgi:hypothetical protein
MLAESYEKTIYLLGMAGTRTGGHTGIIGLGLHTSGRAGWVEQNKSYKRQQNMEER